MILYTVNSEKKSVVPIVLLRTHKYEDDFTINFVLYGEFIKKKTEDFSIK